MQAVNQAGTCGAYGARACAGNGGASSAGAWVTRHQQTRDGFADPTDASAAARRCVGLGRASKAPADQGDASTRGARTEQGSNGANRWGCR